MAGLIGTLVAVIIGAVLAIGAAIGVVSAMNGTPPPVDAPLVQYGER